MFHGKQLLNGDKREHKIQRDIFLVGSMRLVFSKTKKTDVRIIAYEMPLGKKRRSESIDLVGYDSNLNLYLIEVKRGDNPDTLEEHVVRQVGSYAEMFDQVKSDFEQEFRERFFFDARFRGIIKMVCAPRYYYEKNGAKNQSFAKSYGGDVLFGFFGGIKKGAETELLKASKEHIGVHFYAKTG